MKKTQFVSLLLNATLASTLVVTVVGCSKPVDSVSAPAASTTVGTDIDDSVITSSIKSALLADADIKSFDFKVETRKGEVQLSGYVDNQSQVDRAITITRAVAGVKDVQNNVVLKGAPTTVGKKVDATIMTSRVKAALLADASIKSFDIAVVTRDDEVLLTGFVDNQTQIDRAMEVARGIDGVRLVRNEMSIKK
ncbi:MAG: BON domain-containing protein [Rhodoferax sp.]|jgi:hyperosmotically inducible protein